ncbi:hypothetical protein H4R22_005005 [Coemansia sp. RSA 1290]|nr:hypothetical protein H4R22_005005 [Coemansia sp. RSA 1290]
MSRLSYSQPRFIIGLLALGIITTTLILAGRLHSYWSTEQSLNTYKAHKEKALLDKLAIIFPVNNNTDMQFYRNTWFRDYLFPVCDWPGPECKIVCYRDSTYQTLDMKTICFAQELKNIDKEFFIKLDDDTFVDMDYIVGLIDQYKGWKSPVYISDHQRTGHRDFPDALNGVKYGNGKFYMFNQKLAQCLKPDIQYQKHRNEDSLFGGMVSHGCGESRVLYLEEDDDKIWHKSYTNKNKNIDLAYIKNH